MDLTKTKTTNPTWVDLCQPRYIRPEERRPKPVTSADDGRTWDMADVMALRRADAPRAIPGHTAPTPLDPPVRTRSRWKRRAVGSHRWVRS